MIMQQNETLTIEALSTAYKKFMSRLVDVCTNVTRDIPAFFTLNYTHVELMALKEEYKARGVNKKVPARHYLDKAVLAVERSIQWLQVQQTDHKSHMPEKTKTDVSLQWTADGIGLLEMAMALHERRAVNNGEVSITAMVNFIFNLFDMKPGNFFSTYGVMRIRAKSRTLFLDELKNSLENKMERDDNKEVMHRKRK
jgi:hypothetical protein